MGKSVNRKQIIGRGGEGREEHVCEIDTTTLYVRN